MAINWQTTGTTAENTAANAERARIFQLLTAQGKHQEAYDSLQPGYVPSAQVASAAPAQGLLSSLGSADAAALLRLLAQQKEAEDLKQLNEQGRQDDEGVDGDIPNELMNLHRFGLNRTDAQLKAITEPDPFNPFAFAGGLGSGAVSFLMNKWQQDKYDKAQELIKIRNSQFDFDKDYTTTDGVIDPEQSIFVDLEAGGTEAQKNYIENYFAERRTQQSDLQRQNVLDNPDRFGFGDVVSGPTGGVGSGSLYDPGPSGQYGFGAGVGPNLQPHIRSKWEVGEEGIVNTGGLISPNFSLDDFIRNYSGASQSFPAAPSAAPPPNAFVNDLAKGLLHRTPLVREEEEDRHELSQEFMDSIQEGVTGPGGW